MDKYSLLRINPPNNHSLSSAGFPLMLTEIFSGHLSWNVVPKHAESLGNKKGIDPVITGPLS